MSLFDVEDPSAHCVYKNLMNSDRERVEEQRSKLDKMWRQYEPYADSDFKANFRSKPYERFWEMYVSIKLMDEGKRLRLRDEFGKKERNKGPDICILEEGRKIWIEAVCPGLGEDEKPDSVPGIGPEISNEITHPVPKRQIHLRVTNALTSKVKKLKKYLENGLISKKDSCVIAISGSQFLDLSSSDCPPEVLFAVYPLGAPHVEFSNENEAAGVKYFSSSFILKESGAAVDRSAFLDRKNGIVSGLIWSVRRIGDFCVYSHDLQFIHNAIATRPFPKNWVRWHNEFVAEADPSGNGSVSWRQAGDLHRI